MVMWRYCNLAIWRFGDRNPALRRPPSHSRTGATNMADSNCIFCKIVAGQIPCHKVYEDEHVLAFLDIGPLSPGHTLVIPKQHWVKLDEVTEEAGAAIGRVLPRLSRAVKAATG